MYCNQHLITPHMVCSVC